MHFKKNKAATSAKIAYQMDGGAFDQHAKPLHARRALHVRASTRGTPRLGTPRKLGSRFLFNTDTRSILILVLWHSIGALVPRGWHIFAVVYTLATLHLM